MGLNDILPAKVRKVLYAVYAFLGLGLTASAAGYLAAASELPVWLVVATAVYGVLGTGLGFTAAANTSPRVTVIAGRVASDDDVAREI